MMTQRQRTITLSAETWPIRYVHLVCVPLTDLGSAISTATIEDDKLINPRCDRLQATLNALRFIEHDHETGQLATFSHAGHLLRE
jgi:hypothetical protein